MLLFSCIVFVPLSLEKLARDAFLTRISLCIETSDAFVARAKRRRAAPQDCILIPIPVQLSPQLFHAFPTVKNNHVWRFVRHRHGFIVNVVK